MTSRSLRVYIWDKNVYKVQWLKTNEKFRGPGQEDQTSFKPLNLLNWYISRENSIIFKKSDQDTGN